MDKQKQKTAQRKRRHQRVRARIQGTSERPRLSVYKSNKGMYLQLIDDEAGKTLVSVYSGEIKNKKGTKTEISLEMGKQIADKAKKAKIEEVVFDRGGFPFHGRVKSVADGAREGGLKF